MKKEEVDETNEVLTRSLLRGLLTSEIMILDPHRDHHYAFCLDQYSTLTSFFPTGSLTPNPCFNLSISCP